MENETEERCKDIADKLTAHLNREETKRKMFQWRTGIDFSYLMFFIICFLKLYGYFDFLSSSHAFL